MVAVIDYGVGNLHSVKKAFAFVGADAVVTADPRVILQADHVVLPGVGAFADARRLLRESGAEDALLEAVTRGRPVLGICLGMQLLYEASYEHGRHQGLGLLAGEVRPFTGEFKIPHMGWNSLEFYGESPLFSGLQDGCCVYFVHSYHVPYGEDRGFTGAVCRYHVPFVAACQKGNLFATQFHPEKSGEVGLTMLRNFASL